MSTLSAKQRESIVAKLADTSGDRDSEVCDHFNIELDELEEIMLDANYERCPECDWWCECGELVDEDGELCSCEQCRPKRED